MKNIFLNRCNLFCSAALMVMGAGAAEKSRPNIIFILADDLGYMDVGAFAQHTLGTSTDKMFFETPNINKLAGEGIAFSSAYVCPLSSPTRSELLTGKYAATMGFTTALPMRDTWYMTGQKPPKGEYIHDAINHNDKINIQQAWINGKSNSAIPAGLPIDEERKCVTLPEALKGYHSAFVGKWHVGGMGADGYQPADRGFEEVLAYCDSGASRHFNWQVLWNNKTKTRFPNMPQKEWKYGYGGNWDTKEEFLTDDLTARAVEYIGRKAKSDDNKPFLLYFSQFAVHTPIQAKHKDIDYFNKKDSKGWNNHKDVVYAGLVRSLDESVGKIMNKLEECGIADNTIIIFLSDNGGIAGKITDKDWITDNAPYLGGKATLYEGGIKSPMIMRWKNHIKAGQWCNVTVDACDIFPTLLELGGIDPTPYYNVNKIDGRSILPLTTDNKNSKKKYTRDTFMFHYPFNVSYKDPIDGFNLTPHSAIRSNNLKLIFDWHGRLYLFDMMKDPYERNNIALERKGDTKKLFAKLISWLDSNVDKQYWPKRNIQYDPKKEVRNNYPFIDLVAAYRAGEDIVDKAIIPNMDTLVIP